MTKVIAFDAATTTGFAYRNGTRWIHGHFHIRDYALLNDVIAAARADNVTHAVIEDPYFHANVNTIKILQDAASRIQQRCEDAGILWAEMKASEWQSAQGVKRKGEDTKVNAMVLSRQLDAPPYLTQDEADAVCMCDYPKDGGSSPKNRPTALGLLLARKDCPKLNPQRNFAQTVTPLV